MGNRLLSKNTFLTMGKPVGGQKAKLDALKTLADYGIMPDKCKRNSCKLKCIVRIDRFVQDYHFSPEIFTDDDGLNWRMVRRCRIYRMPAEGTEEFQNNFDLHFGNAYSSSEWTRVVLFRTRGAESFDFPVK